VRGLVDWLVAGKTISSRRVEAKEDVMGMEEEEEEEEENDKEHEEEEEQFGDEEKSEICAGGDRTVREELDGGESAEGGWHERAPGTVLDRFNLDDDNVEKDAADFHRESNGPEHGRVGQLRRIWLNLDYPQGCETTASRDPDDPQDPHEETGASLDIEPCFDVFACETGGWEEVGMWRPAVDEDDAISCDDMWHGRWRGGRACLCVHMLATC